MRTLLFTLFFAFIAPSTLKAQQSTAGIYFQAIARDQSTNPLNSRNIRVKASILDKMSNGLVLFSETHAVQTDASGVFNIAIGNGIWIDGIHRTIHSIDWAAGIHYLNLQMAITPIAPSIQWDYNKEWIDLGTSIFGVVPYALNIIGDKRQIIDTSLLTVPLKSKLNIADTASMLFAYAKKSAIPNYTLINNEIEKKLNRSDSLSDYVTPTQLASISFDTLSISNRIEQRLKLTDTVYLSQRIQEKLKLKDTIFLSQRIDDRLKSIDTIYLAQRIDDRLKFTDTVSISNRIENRLVLKDTMYISNRIDLKEALANKSIDMNAVNDYTDQKYPSVKATKDYVDGQLSQGAADASINNKGIVQLAGDLTGTSIEPRIAEDVISTNKVVDAAITDAKIASGIQASKVGLGNVTNHAQLYSFNGLTTQSQNFSTPGLTGLAPNWISVGSSHLLNIPMANATAVSAGLISQLEYDNFNNAYTTSFNTLTTTGVVGAASVVGKNINIPNYSLAGLSGTINPNFILAGPESGLAGGVQYRALVAADIPNNNATTTGNAATATKLQNIRTINSVDFDGTNDIIINATTINSLKFDHIGSGAITGTDFNGSVAKTISYNTIGAAPANGSNSIGTLGTITTGTWAASIIGSNYGGAGAINGLLKANGSGVVSAASPISDFQTPLVFASPLVNTTNTIAMNQANTSSSGYLSNTDWNSFNNKINQSEKATANGVATLNALGKIPTSQIPAISFSSGYVVSSESAMLGLSAAVVGSIAIRTDNSKNYVLSASDPSIAANWLELLMPAAVSSVNGYTTGSITLTSSDIAEGANLYFNNARVRTSVDGFLAGDAPISYNSSSGKITITPSSTSTNGYLSSTDWNNFNNKQNTFASQSANSFYAAPNGLSGTPIFRTILATDIPILNQNTTGNAATASALLNTRTINGINFNGTENIVIPSNTSNAITFNNSGTGAVSTTSFNGSSPIVVSYNTIGALPTVGANTITTLGAISSGTWNANVIGSNYGGAGSIIGLLKANGAGVVSAAVLGTDYEAPLSFSLPLIRAANAISIQTATTSNNGILSSSDWQLFNNKQATITAGTGVTITGGNTINIGQAIGTSSSPSFAGITISGLTVSGLVANSAAGVLSTVGTTGTGLVVKQNSPTLVTPTLGVATATSVNVGTITATSSIASNGDIKAKRFVLTMPSGINSATTTTIDLSLGNVLTINLVANITTLTLTNPAVGTYLIKFVQDGTGGRTVVFPTGWKWAGGIVPTVTSSANKLDIVTLIYDGTNYYSTIVKNF